MLTKFLNSGQNVNRQWNKLRKGFSLSSSMLGASYGEEIPVTILSSTEMESLLSELSTQSSIVQVKNNDFFSLFFL